MMTNVTLKVEGMSCGHCVSAVEKALSKVGASGSVDLASKTVKVQFDESKIQLDAVREAIEEQGYDVV